MTFIYFDARRQGNSSALLSWKTSREANASHYDVERSMDALNFTYIGKVTATGTSTLETAYSFTDHAPAKGLNYYRLKQVDKDGHFKYTAARVLRFDGLDAGTVRYYPNPTNGILNVEVTEATGSQVKWITISNELGMVISQLRLDASSNIVIPLNLSKYAKGTYFIQLNSGEINSTQRIVIQ